MKRIKTTTLVLSALLVSTFAAAQESAGSFEVTPGVDFVSKYIWRGMNQGGGASIQPSLTLGWDFGLSLGMWGSSSIADFDKKEVDLSLGFEKGGFSATFTDYWWEGEGAKYGHYKDDHYFELGLAYNFGDNVPLTISWATMLFAGEASELDENDDRMYSTYINFSYDFDVKGTTLTPAIGINPWKSQFDDEFSVLDITLTGSKEIEITDKFKLPLFVQLVVSPAFDDVHAVVGLTF